MKPQQADESFSLGPVQLARYGEYVVLESNWEKSQHEHFLAMAAERYPSVVSEIDELVACIVDAVSVLPPEKVLHRAWCEQVMSSRHIKAESDVTAADSIAMRMIDYVQSVIAAAPRGEQQKDAISEQDWGHLQRNVEALFHKLNIEFPTCQTAHNRIAGVKVDKAMEEFLARAQMYWCNVRGNDYHFHQVDALADVLRPQSALIEAAYKLTSSQLVGELRKLWHAQIFGLHEAMGRINEIREEVMTEIERVMSDGATEHGDNSFQELLHATVDKLGYRNEMESGVASILGTRLFDVNTLTALPQNFLDDFSWLPGQDVEFLADGQYKGWPLRIQPIFRRPFLKVDDRSYCFDLHSLFDNFYRQLEKRIFQRSESEKQEWIANRKAISEELPVEYLLRLLPGATVFREVYYPMSNEAGTGKNWCEADCLIIYDDHAFIVEVKAGAFTYTSPANDLPAYVSSLKALVEAPSKQGQRLLAYLNSADKVALYDSKHRQIDSINTRDLRVKTVCAITLDPFTELAAKAQHLQKLGIDLGDAKIWPFSISDLRVYADIFAGPLDFLHYVEQRMRAATSEVVELDDELDHLGLYLEHNNYALRAADLSQNGHRPHFSGYRTAIDKFYSAKLAGNAEVISPAQNVPARLRQIIDHLVGIQQFGRARIAAFLLDMAGDWRDDLNHWIDEELRLIPTRGRCLPLSSYGSTRVTAFVSVDGVALVSHAQAVEHAQAVIAASGEADRLLLELTYHVDGTFIRAELSTVTLAGLSPHRLDALKVMAAKLKEKRIARSVAEFGKIGRNEPCPCGSLKKFKQCCLR